MKKETFVKLFEEAEKLASEPVSGETLLAIFSKYVNFSDTEIYALIKNNALIVQERGPGILQYKFQIDIKKFREIAPLILEEGYGSRKERFDLLLNYPKGIGMGPFDGFMDLYSEISRLIVNSKVELRVVNPYFDEEGNNRILPALKAAAADGVKVRMISRPDIPPELKGLILRTSGINLRHFYGERGETTFSAHAKFLIADDARVYLGSANFTKRSLESNVETGVIFSGPRVPYMINLFEGMWKKSAPFE